MEVNEHGVIIDYEKEKFEAGSSNNYSGRAEVRLGEHNGRWYMAISYSVYNSGYGAAPSITENKYAIKNGIPYFWSTRQEALDFGLDKLKGYLNKEVAGSRFGNETGIKQAKELLIQIQQSKQLSLF